MLGGSGSQLTVPECCLNNQSKESQAGNRTGYCININRPDRLRWSMCRDVCLYKQVLQAQAGKCTGMFQILSRPGSQTAVPQLCCLIVGILRDGSVVSGVTTITPQPGGLPTHRVVKHGFGQACLRKLFPEPCGTFLSASSASCPACAPRFPYARAVSVSADCGPVAARPNKHGTASVV